jgi:hypothetical protein
MANLIRRGVQRLKKQLAPLTLPRRAHAERREDLQGLPALDPGVEQAIDAGVAWLSLAQDRSISHDGGIARHYSLIDGWGPSYPETTGYIIPTMLAYARLRANDWPRNRAKRMLDWLVSIQTPCGGFQGSTVSANRVVPVTFNTGQILIGLASGVDEFGLYRESMRRAADWLVETQDADGCWRKHPTPFAALGEKTYETHVAWGLLDAARVEPDRPYADAALANVRWALGRQHDNGWLEDCCLTDPSQPLTHTLGYALRGIIEAYRFSKDPLFLRAAQKTADGLLQATREDGFLPGRLRSDWSAAVDWACLTGTVQIAHCWLMLYRYTRKTRYREAGFAANRYVRCTIKLQGAPETLGGIKGSFPVSGDYGQYQYLNWAAKFFVDSNMMEREVRLGRDQSLEPAEAVDHPASITQVNC